MALNIFVQTDHSWHDRHRQIYKIVTMQFAGIEHIVEMMDYKTQEVVLMSFNGTMITTAIIIIKATITIQLRPFNSRKYVKLTSHILIK